MLNLVAQGVLVALHLQALAQLEMVDGHVCGRAADVDVGVMGEISLGIEALVVVVCHGLGQHAVVQVVVELQVVSPEVVADILRHAEVNLAAVLGLDVLVKRLLPVAHDHLHQHVLNRGLPRCGV